MPGLVIHRSNRSEHLASSMAAYLKDHPVADPIAADPVVVHSQGMGRWLSMVLSQELGICSNIQFSFPAKILRTIMARALDALDGRSAGADGDPDRDPWDPDRLAWILLDELPGRLDGLDPAMREYLEASGDGVVRRKEYLLARRIANLFDEYANYRPDWIGAWEDGRSIEVRGRPVAPDAPGGTRDWQATLWRAIRKRVGQSHPAGRIGDAVRALRDTTLAIPDLPPRLCLFGISTLPPSFVQVLVALSARIDVRLFALSPSREYFGDMLTDDESARYLADHLESPVEDLHDYGNPLLKSLGKLGRDFHGLLTLEEARDGASHPVVEDYEDPAPAEAGTMLGILQSDILNLRHRRVGGDAEPIPRAGPDGSIRFHACHGALRQVEVLRDELLRLFKEDSTLQPRDVVVMSPDIDAFAPLIDAVFSDGDDRNESRAPATEPPAPRAATREPAGFPALRHQIADRSARQLNVAAEIVSRLLGLAAGRLPASEVLDLLALEPVRRKFDLDVEDIESVHTWVGESGVRWGLDEDHRESQQQPRDRLNTWRFGLDRLMVGVAMPGEGRRTFAGVLPYDEIEGSQARILGRFARFCDTLFAACAEIRGESVAGDPAAVPGARSLADWEDLARRLVDTFIDLPGSQYWKIRKTLEVFRDLAKIAPDATFDRRVDADTLRALLDERLASSSSSSALLAGGLNFCALVPMRTIPFKVVCLLGMDDGLFPRQQRRLGFDLLSRHPKTGDRSPRDDDRHLFLEALLAARSHLVVTWNGRSIRDNADLPPAVPVGELLDVLADTFAVPGETFEERRRQFVARQHLQSFSPDNFRSEACRGFDRRALKGAIRLVEDRKPDAAFFAGALAEPPPGERIVSVDDLVRFFENPIRHLMHKRLGVRLDDGDDEVEDREPIALDGLENWAVGDEIVKAMLEGEDPEVARRGVRLKGRIPLGIPGEQVLDGLLVEAGAIVAEAMELRTGEHLPVDASLEVGGVSIRGTLDDVWSRGQVLVQYSRVKAKRVLAAWIRHLLACAADPRFSGRTWLVGRSSESPKWPAVLAFHDREEAGSARQERARAILERLVALYRHGWCQPLLLFPESSCAYVRAFSSPRAGSDGDRKGREAASAQWLTGESRDYPREDADPWFQWILQGEDPWAPGFDLAGLEIAAGFLPVELARAVWEPLLAATRDEATEVGE